MVVAPEAPGNVTRNGSNRQFTCIETLTGQRVDVRYNIRQAIHGVQPVCKGAHDEFASMHPVIFPHVNELVTLLACLARFLSVIAVGERLGTCFFFSSLRVPEHAVELDGEAVVRHDDIEFFARGENCMVVTEDCARRHKRANHLSQECLRWVGMEPVAHGASRGFHTVARSGQPCVLGIDCALPEHRRGSTFARSRCEGLIDELYSQIGMCGRKIIDTRDDDPS